MPVTIGLVANVYNEANALPGWLECHLPYFDDVRIFHAGPGGARSDDGTMELLEKWHIPVAFGAIDDGFGAVRTAAMAGLTRIIGFDMGGTSTDVSHYDGEYERAFETEVAGVRMRAPMMAINTVAAGPCSVMKWAWVKLCRPLV